MSLTRLLQQFAGRDVANEEKQMFSLASACGILFCATLIWYTLIIKHKLKLINYVISLCCTSLKNTICYISEVWVFRDATQQYKHAWPWWMNRTLSQPVSHVYLHCWHTEELWIILLLCFIEPGNLGTVKHHKKCKWHWSVWRILLVLFKLR